MLVHVFNGSKIIFNNDLIYKISDSQSIFMSKGQYFISEVLSIEKSYFDGIMVFFDDEFLLSIFDKHKSLKERNKNKNNSPICIVENSKLLHETMLSVYSYLQKGLNEPMLVQLKFEEIFLQLLQSNESKEILTYFQVLYSGSLFKFKDLFESNDFNNVQDMIYKSKLSEPRFRKLFNELYNTTPKKWLLIKNLEKSKKLLEYKELNVTEICFECGFNSTSWFVKSFKNEFGITPKQYQQNC